MEGRSRWLLPFLALVAAGCSRPAADPLAPDRAVDAARIAAAILRHEARLPRERNPTCVATRTDGIAFDGNRESLRSAREWSESNPKDAELKRRVIEGHSSPGFIWRKPGTAIAYAFGSGVPVSKSENLEFTKAAAAIVNAPAQPSALRSIRWTWIPWSMRSWFWYRLCPASLSLTAPAFHGDLAFVETSHVCGGLCGYGWIYALRRKDDEWTIVALAQTWVS